MELRITLYLPPLDRDRDHNAGHLGEYAAEKVQRAAQNNAILLEQAIAAGAMEGILRTEHGDPMGDGSCKRDPFPR